MVLSAIFSWQELHSLTGSEKGWNGRRGVVVSIHQALHPSNYNIRRIVCELAMEGRPMNKTTFFSEKVRKVTGDRAPTRRSAAKQRPNDRCACGSGKKFKKCCPLLRCCGETLWIELPCI